MRDVVLGTLTRGRLKALHRLAFLALHSQPGAGDADAAPALAHHAFKGEEWEHAARFAVKSMARAISRSANQEALQLFEMGVEASRQADHESTPQALELALRLEAIGAMMALGHIDEIFKNMERAEIIAAQLNDQPHAHRFRPDGVVSLDARAIRAKVCSTPHGAWTRPALRNGAT